MIQNSVDTSNFGTDLVTTAEPYLPGPTVIAPSGLMDIKLQVSTRVRGGMVGAETRADWKGHVYVCDKDREEYERKLEKYAKKRGLEIWVEWPNVIDDGFTWKFWDPRPELDMKYRDRYDCDRSSEPWMDHCILFVKNGKPHTIISQPYQLDGDGIIRLAEIEKVPGVEVMVSCPSFYGNGTVLIKVRKEE